MLKKTLSLAAVVAMFIFVGTAGAATETDTAAVEVVISEWLSISFDAGLPQFDVAYAGVGTTADSDTEAYTATGNANATISLAVTTDVDSQPVGWSWTGYVDDGATATHSHTAGATTTGTAMLTLSGLSSNDTAGTYSNGVATITITND